MPRQLQPADPAEVAAAYAVWRAGNAARAELKLLVKHTLARLQLKAPGASVEVRIPPYAAVQVIEGVRHTRGTPPAVIETDADTWLRVAFGLAEWGSVLDSGLVRASGERTDLTGLLPLERP